MKKRLLLLTVLVMALVCLLAISASAAAPLPTKPDLGVDFGTVTKIDGFTPPSQLFVNTTERVLLVDGDGNPLCGSYSFNLDVDAYIDFLEKGLKKYDK
jgi:hypothetical protein